MTPGHFPIMCDREMPMLTMLSNGFTLQGVSSFSRSALARERVNLSYAPGGEGVGDVSVRIKFGTLAMVALIAGCAGPRSGVTWYEARCIDQYGMQRGTGEFAACVSREQRIVEETQRRSDQLDP
jgi:hypothetical protein